MQIHEAPESVARLSDSIAFRRASRIAAALIASGFALSTWYAVQAVRFAYLGAARPIFPPPHAARQALGTILLAVPSMAFFAWAAATNYPWEKDGEDLD